MEFKFTAYSVEEIQLVIDLLSKVKELREKAFQQANVCAGALVPSGFSVSTPPTTEDK